MSSQKNTEAGNATHLDIRHLRRETRTALELAIVALAPTALVDRLATAAGLLEALAQLPKSAPAAALTPSAVERAHAALAAWQQWETKHALQG